MIPVNGTIWLTGLSGAGKSTLGKALRDLSDRPSVLLDGDDLRGGLSSDLGFSSEDRAEAVRRSSEIALVLASQGLLVVVAMISPYRSGRSLARKIHEDARVRFIEVYLAATRAECEARDSKSLYRLARSGNLPDFTGVSSNYEVPASADFTIEGHSWDPEAVAATVLRRML